MPSIEEFDMAQISYAPIEGTSDILMDTLVGPLAGIGWIMDHPD